MSFYGCRMTRAELLMNIKQRGWSFRPAVSGKEFYGLVKSQYGGHVFYFHGAVPYLSHEDHTAFWEALIEHAGVRTGDSVMLSEVL